jgi:signal peptidase II
VWGGYRFLLLVAGGVALLDQGTKIAVLHLLPLHDSVVLLPGFFNLTHVQNPGGAFGFLAGASTILRRVLFLVASALAIGMLFAFFRSTPQRQPFLRLAFALILGGAVGNFIDRLWLGRVIDFLDLHVGTLHWPAFNVADSGITIGIAIFVYHLLFRKLPE